MRTIPLTIIGALLLALPALAQDGPPRKGPHAPKGKMKPTPEMRQKMIERFDKDGDGKLNQEERKAARKARQAMKKKMEAFRKKMLKRFDKDGDGKLSPEERKTAHETMRKELLEKYDANGDGKLSKEERRKAVEDGVVPPHPPRGAHGCDECKPEGKGKAKGKDKGKAKGKKHGKKKKCADCDADDQG